MVQVAYWLWVAFVAVWNVAALWTGRVGSKAPAGQRLAYLVAYVLGFGLLFTQSTHGAVMGFAPWLPARSMVPLWDSGKVAAILVATELVAFGFALWARSHLGRLWSGMMTLRDSHRVVDTGPYRLVRHPIYTGFIGASLALALLVATPAALAGALVLIIVMTAKAHAEEALLRRELGRGDYDAYAAHTPMLVPFASR